MERKTDDLRLLWPHPRMPSTNRRANGVQTATVSPDPGEGGRRYVDAEAEYRCKGKGKCATVVAGTGARQTQI
jgi:hypothetical protein